MLSTSKQRWIIVAAVGVLALTAWQLAARSYRPAVAVSAEPVNLNDTADPELLAMLRRPLQVGEANVSTDHTPLYEAVTGIYSRLVKAPGWAPPPEGIELEEPICLDGHRGPWPPPKPTTHPRLGIYLDRAALTELNLEPDVPVRYTRRDGETVEDVLKAMLASIQGSKQPLGYAVIGQVVFVSTQQRLAMHRRLHLLDLRLQDPPGLKNQLTTPVAEFRVNNVGFADVISFLQMVSGRKIRWDRSQMEAYGIDQYTPITCEMTNVSFRQTLRIVLTDAVIHNSPLEMTVEAETGEIDVRHPPGGLP